MKTKIKSKLMSILLVLVMVLSIVPFGALPAFAAGPTEIEELTLSFMNSSEIPAVGDPIKYMLGGRLTETDDRIELTGNVLLWRIDNTSVVVNQTYDDTGMYYEAGRTYNSEIVVEVLNPDQYTIGENTKITLTNPGDFTYTSEVSNIIDTGSSFYAYMKLTITMNGERTYPDITKVVFKDLVSPTDGMSVTESSADIYYSNCQMTSGLWMGNVWGKDEHGNNTFVAGETYTYQVILTAKDGYKFDENPTIQLTSGGVLQSPSHYAFTNDNKTLTLNYTYTIPSVTWLDCVEATIKRYEQDLTPIAGESCTLFDNTLEVDEAAPYHIVGELGRTWYSEDGTKLGNNDLFEAGKTYYFEYAYSIKNEYRHLYRFVPDNLTTTITGESYTGNGFKKVERVESSNLDDTYVKFRYYFTAQFPSGIGSSASNPAYCYSYEEFKYAMESPNIRYVALGNVDDMLPLVSMSDASPYGDNRCPGIWVRGTKDLILMGNAQFTAPNATENVHRVYENLLLVQSGSRLTISGAGGLTFHGNAVGWPTSVIQVTTDGVLFVDGGTITGDTGNRTAFCYGINVNGGKLYVNGGTVVGTNRHNQTPISAILLYDGVANIHDGTFYSNVSDGAAGSKHYGLMIEENATCYLYGGGFKGISMPYASVMSDYIENGYTLTVDGVKTDPASCGTTSGFVEVYQEISSVNIHVNSPAAGKSPAIYDSEVYLVPEGAIVESITWYENGQPWNTTTGSARFTAGNTYTVVIVLTADDGMKFANPLTSATVNYKNATVSTIAGNAETGVILTVDLGECPNIVPQVDLTITAPKEGNTPSYTIGCGSDAYYAVGGSSNYTEYRTWYMSSDNDDWWEINGSHKFMAGYYYKLVVDIRTNNGYEFPLIDVGTIQPDVTATVNGYSANVIKAYDQDPSRYITVEYNFGECNDSVVENIIIENVTAPVAGEKPNYNWSIRGNGYQMDTSKNAYYDAYWKNPPEQWYYIKNGLGWFDVTDYDWVYENETFIAGHEYEVRVYVITGDGFEFAHNNYYEPTVTATVNGNTAEAIVDGSYCVTTQQIEYTFTCGAKTVDKVAITDLENPVGGNTPDTTVTVGDSDSYTVESVEWFDIEDNPAAETFESGVPYYALITVAPATGAVFADAETIDVTVNGSELDSVEIKDGKLLVYVIIRKPASAPEMSIYAFITQPSGGTVNAGESLNVAWQTSFIPTSTEIQYWDGEAWDQWDIQSPQNALDDYDFESHEAASYRFRIVTYIGNDAVATSNEFVIVWEDNEVSYCYCTNGAEGSNKIGYATVGEEITLDGCTFTAPKGKRFKAWAIGSVNGEQKQPGDKITITEETYIYAIWEDLPHTCVGISESGQGATCTVDGWKDYYRCECGKYYEDANCQTPINDLEAWKVGAGKITAAHSGTPEWTKTATTHAKKYTCCDTFVVETEAHEWNNGVCSECEYVCLHTADTNKDHKCDACGSTVGTHEAALGKHTCDYCEKTVTECEDSNKDHKCDTCGETMGTHVAASGKHTCDYCGKTASECADANDDGKCDICGANYGACVDSNKDHLCDKHGETMGTHEAALGKHTCDYCNKPVTECSDDNKDHKCDTCGEAMGTHVAASGKHTCDYCNKVVTECADGNKDHKCDTCSTAMGTHVAATGKHTCDYCGKTVTECSDSDKNHKCDTCSSNMGTHEAANGKHTCDYCTEVVTQCVDSNKDHKCDICGTAMGTHEAASGKHTCDYCGKTVTECADTNSDGKCDTCGANYGECVDSNKDHKCDKHGETMGTHEAALGKHTCDYCGQTVTECEDANKDHKCDTCETAIGTHEAATGKHTCDYCGKTVTECADSNKDHKCDTCSTAMGTHEAADGKHTCDYCGKTVTDCTDSNKDHKCDTCSTAMGTHEAANGKHTCDYCGVAITECVDTNKDHKCDTCGASVGVHNAATGKHTCDYCGKTVTECTDSSEDDDSKCDICGKNIGDCVDANKDHKCDKHDENMGVHEAALGKHTCDYCGKTVTECADANKDHRCDTCETAIGTHEAATGKHTCDYCGKTVTECADSDKNHKCDTCSTAMGTHEAANGKHSCDYCGKDVTECSDGNTDGKCDVCQKDLGTVHTHDYGTTWKADANEHWNECACGDKANKAAHTDSNNDGKCDTCEYQMTNGGGNTETPDNPNNTPDNPNNTPDDPSDDKNGLGAGAIVGIVIGSVAVVGIGGFALFWFVIKKKSFADLIAVFKK